MTESAPRPRTVRRSILRNPLTVITAALVPAKALPMSEQTPSTGPRALAPARRTRVGGDRVTVALFSLAAFLIVLALLGTQLSRAGSTRSPSSALLVRRIYTTTVIERVLPAGGEGGSGGASVTQSVSGASAGSLAPVPLPVTRTS